MLLVTALVEARLREAVVKAGRLKTDNEQMAGGLSLIGKYTRGDRISL